MSDVDDVERTLKLDLMRMDLSLKTKQVIWETPRNNAIQFATVAAIAGALGLSSVSAVCPCQST